MKAIITGMNGTVAPYLGQELSKHGFEVIAWDRSLYPTDNLDAGKAFLAATQPDWFFHVGMGPAIWAEFLAKECAQRGIAFTYTSTVSVYEDRERGPITPETPADGTSEYAKYKLESEERILSVNPGAIVARISWQIGAETGTNNMYAQLADAAKSGTPINASTRWFPASAMLADTATALYRLQIAARTGIYLVDSNRKWNYFQIVSAINRSHGSPWVISAVDDFVLDLRMFDERVSIPLLEESLPELEAFK